MKKNELILTEFFENASNFTTSGDMPMSMWTVNTDNITNMFKGSGVPSHNEIDENGTPNIDYFNEGYMSNSRGYYKDA